MKLRTARKVLAKADTLHYSDGQIKTALRMVWRVEKPPTPKSKTKTEAVNTKKPTKRVARVSWRACVIGEPSW